MRRAIVFALLVVLFAYVIVAPTNNLQSNETIRQLKTIWETDNLDTLEVLKVIPGELYVRYKAPDAVEPRNDEERFIGYKNIIQRVDLDSGELMWDQGFVNTVMEQNSLGNLVQRRDDILVTFRTVVCPSEQEGR